MVTPSVTRVDLSEYPSSCSEYQVDLSEYSFYEKLTPFYLFSAKNEEKRAKCPKRHEK